MDELAKADATTLRAGLTEAYLGLTACASAI